MDTDKQFYFQWHFLEQCNLRCKHCYQSDYACSEFDFEILKKIADKIFLALKKWGMQGRISLTGGEPFLSKSLFPLLHYLDESEYITSLDILTNGTLMKDSDILKLLQVKKLHQIQISLDGGDAESHDKIRGAGNFERALDAIRRLKKNGLSVALMFTLMKSNKDAYKDVIHLADKENVDALTIERVTPCGHSNSLDILTKDEIHSIYVDVTKIANDLRDTLTIRRARPLWINTACYNQISGTNIGGFCPVGLTALAILWDGTVLPCRRLEIPLGNILTDGLFKIWYDSDILWKIRDKTKLKGKCNSCDKLSYCGGCRAIAYATKGDYMESDIQCWI